MQEPHNNLLELFVVAWCSLNGHFDRLNIQYVVMCVVAVLSYVVIFKNKL